MNTFNKDDDLKFCRRPMPALEALSAPILLVNDDEAYASRILKAIKDASIAHPLLQMGDAFEAREYLTKAGMDVDSEYRLPSMLLIDLNRPIELGFSLLEWIRKQNIFDEVSIVFLSVSREEADLQRAYDMGANSFVVRPNQAKELTAVFEALRDYWKLNGVNGKK